MLFAKSEGQTNMDHKEQDLNQIGPKQTNNMAEDAKFESFLNKIGKEGKIF